MVASTATMATLQVTATPKRAATTTTREEELTASTFKPLLLKLVSHPETFTSQDLTASLQHLFTPDVLDPAQAGAFLTALHLHDVAMRADMLSAATGFLLARAESVNVQGGEEGVVDIVGTGGDGHGTFNVSTTAAVVAAGAGARVIKHGGRASTSPSGSADLLSSLGCHFPSPPSPLPNIPFTFLHAPLYHPALLHISPLRRALPFRTILNLLGPLLNPARPTGIVLGVADPRLGEVFARALARDGGHVQRALVVCGEEALDEISCAGRTHVWDLRPGTSPDRPLLTTYAVHPHDFGLPTHALAAVASGTPAQNAQTFREILTAGPGGCPEHLVPVRDFVLLNAAALLVVADRVKDWKEGVEMARASVESGRAWEALEAFRVAGITEGWS